MDLPNTDHAGELNAQRVQRQRRLNSKDTTELLERQSGSLKRKQKHKDSSSTTVYYRIKGILSERKSGKITEFLIDWEDNPVTREIYEPSWEPYSNVTPVAIYEWESKRAIHRYKSNSQLTTSQDRKPTRLAKKRRTNNSEVSISSDKGKAPYSTTATRRSVGSKNKVREIKDSCEDEESDSGDHLSVLIAPNKDINPKEYIVVRSSQLSNYSNSQENLQEPSPLQVRVPPDSQILLPRRKLAPAFIWDEDIEPESQYPFSSASYKPSISRSATAGDCEEVLQSVQPEISDRVRKGIARSSLEAILTQHTDTVDTVTIATKEQQQEDSINNINSRKNFEKASFPDSLIIENSSSLDLGPAQSAPQESLTPKSQHLKSQALGHTASGEPFQEPPASDLSLVSKTPISESQQSFVHLLSSLEEEEEGADESQVSLEIPDSYLVSDTFTKSSQGVDAQIGSQDRASSLPSQSHPRTVQSDSQPSQSLPSATVIKSSPEEIWQAAQIVTQIPRASSQELLLEKSQSQGSKDHVQIDNSQVSESTHLSLSHHYQFPDTVSEDYCVTNNHSTEIPETQLSTSEISIEEVSPQVLKSVEPDSDLRNAELLYQEPLSSQYQAESDTYSSNCLPPRPLSHLAVEMSTVGSGASHLAISERRARSTKSRSPSTIPPRISTVPPATSTNHPLPMRDSIADISRSRNRQSSIPRSSIEEFAEMNPDILAVRNLARNEFIVPLPMMSQIRDVYDTTIRNRKKEIMSFLGESTTSDTDSIEMMIEELKLICDHQDLIVEESSTQSLDDSAQARYAVTISTKFLFVQQFLESLRQAKVHVVIVARDAILPILEALFRSQQYNYSRPDTSMIMPGNPGEAENDLMQVTLLPTWIDVRDCIVAPASVVVAFDSSFSESQGGDEYYQILPFDPRNPDKRAPLLWLVIANSVEHVELCIPTTLDSSERKDRLVQYVTQTRKVAGLLDTNIYPDPQQAARRAAEYVMDDSLEAEWPINPIPDIEIVLFDNRANNRLSNLMAQSLFSPIEPKGQSGYKRPSDFDAEDEDTAIKRQRMIPTKHGRQPDINIMGGNMVELQNTIKTLYARCEDYEKSIKRIQPKFQRALDERARFEHENAQAVKRQSEYEKKLGAQDEVAAKLREENAVLKNELSVAKNSLLTSENPSIVESHKTKEDLRTAQAEIERLKKIQASTEKRADYAASLYQESSQQAQEMRNELTTLKSQRKELQRQASAARIEINKINHDGIIQQQVDIIDDLRRELAERERHLGVVSGQLDACMNGRRTTRGTSVPRSPRMSNMSPRPRVLGSMAPGSNTASRGNSPAPGVFGGDLFQGGDAGRRFGAHLQ